MNTRGVRSLARSRSFRVVVVALLLIWAAYQCFWNLLGPNIHGDEAIYVRSGLAYVHGDFSGNREHPPTAKYLFGLAQVAMGAGVLGPRIVVGVLVVLVGATMFFWLRAEAGFWTGVFAAAVWLLTKRDFLGSRVDRLALLDPVMIAFAVMAMATAWWWSRRGHWWIAALSGTLMAMSVTSKVSTIVLLPAFALLPVLFRAWRHLLVGGTAWVVSFLVVGLGLYAPMGVRSAVSYMFHFQEGQNEQGHPLVIAGHVYRFAPWWAEFHFLWLGLGTITTIVMCIGLIAAIVVRPDRLVSFLGAALLLLVVFYVVVARIALANYFVAWVPVIILLAALGFRRIAAPPVPPFPARRLGENGAARSVLVLRAIVVSILVAMVIVPAIEDSISVAHTHPTGIATVPSILDDNGKRGGAVLFAAATPTLYDPYFAGRGSMDPDDGPFAAVVVGTDSRFPPSAEITTFLHTERAALRRIDTDGLHVYLPRRGVVVEREGRLRIVTSTD